MALKHISKPLNEILNRLQEVVEENDKIIKNDIVQSKEDEQKAFLSEEEVALFFSIPAEQLKILRYRRKGPPFANIGGIIRYHRPDVMNYLETVKSR